MPPVTRRNSRGHPYAANGADTAGPSSRPTAPSMAFRNPFRRAQQENESGQIVVHIKWGRDKFNVPIPSPSTTPLSQLIGTLAHQTSIPQNQLKLIFKGAVLKDPSLTVSSYGIQDGSALVLVGKEGEVPSAPEPAPPPQQVVKKKNKQPETDNEQVLVDWINNLVGGCVDPLVPSIATFVSQTSKNATNKPKHALPMDKLQVEHARLSEFLLRGLLDLDGIEIPSGWTNARQARKDGVRRVQGELTKVDDAWGDRKRLGA
ncbi:BAG family molecular chaperone regulator 1 [Vanrija pseudolonga]|uniref:BAG family molecular chaperone regulator 1 n=1 Tax=Vanrija pseudolonga TaxID=143232 RepID=A0AAF0YIK5_9TREE|nr:BAG family molecular chaperone regulator 1 [Vanrija pseudolonga]